MTINCCPQGCVKCVEAIALTKVQTQQACKGLTEAQKPTLRELEGD